MNNRRRSLLAFLAVLGIAVGGTYTAYDSFGSGPNADVALRVHPLTYWSPCSQPPQRPNDLVQTLRNDMADNAPTGGYFLIAPPLSYGLADTPENEVLAGQMDADRARYGEPNDPTDDIPPDVWDKLVIASGDVEVPSVCSPEFDIPIATVNAAMAEMAALGKCLGDVPDPCVQVNYTSPSEWTSHVKPYNNPPFSENTMLWLADWDGDPSFASFNRHPFAGLSIEDILLKQYAGSTPLNGQSVDLDSLEVDQRIFDGVTPTPTPVVTPTPEPTPMIVTWHAPPELRAECYSGIVDARYGDYFNLCGSVWLFPDLSFYDPSTNTHYAANGTALQ